MLNVIRFINRNSVNRQIDMINANKKNISKDWYDAVKDECLLQTEWFEKNYAEW